MSELLSDLDLEESGGDTRRKQPKTQRIEQAIVLMADAVWAVVGLFLWIPQIVRVVVTSVLRLIHSALTRQPIDSIRGPIRQVSHFYVDGFLTSGEKKTAGGYGSRQLQLGRFLIEALWVAAVWLGILRLVSPDLFERAWASLLQFASWCWGWVIDLTALIAAHLPESIQAFANLGTVGNLCLAFALVVFLAAGFILGRRHR